MFSSWDLVRPRFWYPMSSLEQSMMELEHMSDLMTRSHSPFDLDLGLDLDLDREMLATPSNMDDDDFFRDLPVLAREQRTETQHREAAAQPMQTEPDAQPQDKTQPKTTSPAHPRTAVRDNDPNKTTHGAKAKQQQQQQQQQQQSTKPFAQTDTNAGADNQYHRAFSSYSFSDSSIVDDKGRRVTSTRRRYEDSTGRLKAVHERQIEGKKLRTTWNRLGPDDEGQHESVCSIGSPEKFEALWQQTPFGQAQKETIKEQKQQQQQQLDQSQQQSSSTSEPTSKGVIAGAEANKAAAEPTPMEE
ncbi:hypothetical protein PRIC1_006375 [Phytophthora ramorum]